MPYPRLVKDVEDLQDHVSIDRIRLALLITKQSFDQSCKLIDVHSIVPEMKTWQRLYDGVIYFWYSLILIKRLETGIHGCYQNTFLVIRYLLAADTIFTRTLLSSLEENPT